MSSETGSELGDAQAVTPDSPAPAAPAAPAVTDGAPGAGGVGELPVRDREILAFERLWWRFAGAKDEAIRERFGMSATRYYQVLNALVDRPEALAADPMLVRRLRRLRGARQRQRSGRVLGSDPAHD